MFFLTPIIRNRQSCEMNSYWELNAYLYYWKFIDMVAIMIGVLGLLKLVLTHSKGPFPSPCPFCL